MSEDGTAAATFCATFVDEMTRAGVTDAFVCPGSRSTPMAVALEANNAVRVHVHIDERSAGFMALGFGAASGVPAPVLTTSGTAAVELHPAVVEADRGRVPMLALTADRPPEMHDVGAPQTIDQRRLFGTAVRWFGDPGVADSRQRDAWRPLAARALAATVGPPAGPVQVNLAFREPLIGQPAQLPPGRPKGGPWWRPQPVAAVADHLVGAIADAVAGRRGVLVVGGAIEDPEAVAELAEHLGWPLLADSRSGCRAPHSHTVGHFDGLLGHEPTAATLTPEVVLRLGELPASKSLVRWLDGLDAWQVAIERDGWVFDPIGTLSSIVSCEPSVFCAELLDALEDAGPRLA